MCVYASTDAYSILVLCCIAPSRQWKYIPMSLNGVAEQLNGYIFLRLDNKKKQKICWLT